MAIGFSAALKKLLETCGIEHGLVHLGRQRRSAVVELAVAIIDGPIELIVNVQAQASFGPANHDSIGGLGSTGAVYRQARSSDRQDDTAVPEDWSVCP